MVVFALVDFVLILLEMAEIQFFLHFVESLVITMVLLLVHHERKRMKGLVQSYMSLLTVMFKTHIFVEVIVYKNCVDYIHSNMSGYSPKSRGEGVTSQALK